MTGFDDDYTEEDLPEDDEELDQSPNLYPHHPYDDDRPRNRKTIMEHLFG